MTQPFGVRSWQRPKGKRPFVLGHRGARQDAPENTILAFDVARQQGADGVELDVRLDADGRVVVFHDRTLERMTDKTDRRAVERVSRAELERVRVGGEPVPTLQAVLAWSRETGQRLNIELKRDLMRRPELCLQVIAETGAVADAPERIVLSSFDPGLVRALSLGLPEVAVAWLVHAGQRVLRYAPGFALTGASGLHPEAKLLNARSIARHRRQAGFIGTWTVNDTPRARELASLGVDTLISDVPGELLRGLQDA